MTTRRATPAEQLADTFRYALKKGHIAVMEILLRDHGVQLPENAHRLAAWSKDAPAALTFLRHHCGASASAGTMDPERLKESLDSAVRAGDTKAAALLLRWGADPTASDLLYQAAEAEWCSVSLMSLLLDAKADPMAHDRQGEMALFSLVQNYYACHEPLPPYALMEARSRRADQCIRLLLQRPGVSPNARQTEFGRGRSVLEIAMRNHWAANTVTTLLTMGAEPSRASLSSAISNRVHSCVEAFVRTESGAAILGASAETLIDEALSADFRCSAQLHSHAGTLLRHCPTGALPFEALCRLRWHLGFGETDSLGAEAVHAALLYHHRSFPDQPPIFGGDNTGPPAIAGLGGSFMEVREDSEWCPARRRHLEWHAQCPRGLDTAARRLLAAAGAPVEQMEIWLASFRGSISAALSDPLPPPLHLLVSLYA